MATTSIVALSLAIAPVVLPPDIGGAALSYADSGSSCFVAGTPVLMADGGERAIETLRPGDLVRGAGGRVNRVVGIETPRLAGRDLYAFNGAAPFVTAEHPFLTMAGWKSIDPQATARENAALKVAGLKPGDLLTRARWAPQGAAEGNLAPAADVAFWLETVKTVEVAAADPQTIVYNLLLDGDHSYIANGFVVHNKGGEGGESGGGGGGSGGGGESGGGGGEGGDDNGGESGESGDDDGGEGGESGDSGESGESGDSGEAGENGDVNFFSGDPGAADRDLSPSEEADLIGRGWQ